MDGAEQQQQLQRPQTRADDLHSGCKQVVIQDLACNIWLEVPQALPSTKYQDHSVLWVRESFAQTARGIRDSDALILMYDLARPRSFQVLCDFCARCEADGVEVAPGTTLPCLVLAVRRSSTTEPTTTTTRSEAEDAVAMELGKRLAKRMNGSFLVCTPRTGEGLDEVIEAAVWPVINARRTLIRESEETVGDAIRSVLTRRRRTRCCLKDNGSAAALVSCCPGPTYADRWLSPQTNTPRNGAPPRWSMRRPVEPMSQPWHDPDFDTESEYGYPKKKRSGSFTTLSSLTVPCPPEYQLSVDLVEPAATNWAPKF